MNKRLLFSTIKHLNTNFPCSLNFSSESFHAPNLTFTACIKLLQSCAQETDLKGGKQIHAHMLMTGYFHSSPLSTTSLINMYSKCSASISDALSVFLASNHGENAFVYNSIISGCISHDLPKQALQLFNKMRMVGLVPDKFTLPCVIKGCLNIFDVESIHGLTFKLGLEFDFYVGSSLVHSYLKYGFSLEALEMFDELPERDVVIWNAMINGLSRIGALGKALEVFRRMVENEVVPNRFTVTGILSVFSIAGEVYNGRVMHSFVIKMGYDSGIAVSNALIDMYGKCKCVADALSVFSLMIEKDIFSWNSIICVHEQCGEHEKTLRLFRRMLCANAQPDLVTIASVLPACARLAQLMLGRKIHGHMIVNGLGKDGLDGEFDDIPISNAVMDMYAKCGSLREARLVFDKMTCRDVASWNIMIMGYGMHGFGNEALDMFYSMSKVELMPDEVTFVGVLSACSHAGFVRQGHELFMQMLPKYKILPTIEHYTCVIDMLGRAGRLDEAYGLLSTMPQEANPVVWRAFLAGSRVHGNSDFAEIAAQKVFELEPEHCGSYVMLSNVYGAFGRYEEVVGVRHTMREQDVKKTPGCSWIELSNGVHVFVTLDRNHPEELQIYAVLKSLAPCLHEHDYKPNVFLGSI
ncbi:hypothetical protein M9H77_36133 [Catharanthus roseus]|uniref:Uncharacterized protein n=1 Tax=Catharanthus roseus TaxID=4058 RepID=A0ACB9ZRS0_CATRO|nr:hypothetical protein M9H77_36133 [Catharanthus roseus]